MTRPLHRFPSSHNCLSFKNWVAIFFSLKRAAEATTRVSDCTSAVRRQHPLSRGQERWIISLKVEFCVRKMPLIRPLCQTGITRSTAIRQKIIGRGSNTSDRRERAVDRSCGDAKDGDVEVKRLIFREKKGLAGDEEKINFPGQSMQHLSDDE